MLLLLLKCRVNCLPFGFGASFFILLPRQIKHLLSQLQLLDPIFDIKSDGPFLVSHRFRERTRHWAGCKTAVHDFLSCYVVKLALIRLHRTPLF